MDFFQGLNPPQKQAVMAGLGPILVLAGPGSGKTRVLTQRIAYLIGSMGVRPYNILAVTFTNKAAREMEARVTSLLGDDTRGLTLGTFHSICVRILRREAEHLPFQSNFVIFDSDDQLNLVRRALEDLNLDEKRHRPAGIHASISNAKNELISPEGMKARDYRQEVVKRVYQRYQELLLANNALDFDDLLVWTTRLFDEQPAVLGRYARRYEHILVDEFQDTNQVQYRLLSHLASHHGNIFVVGDADQSIYRWRGADYRNVERFESEYYTNLQKILLEQNYRSTQMILDTAMAVIDRNPHRTRRRLFTERGRGEKVVLHTAYDDRVEAAYVVDTIAGQVARKGAQPGDFAIMYRTNAQSRVLEEAFLQAGLPYKLVGAQRFYGRREIKDGIAYLRLVHNPSDELSLSRVINVPPRGIGEKTILALRVQALKAGLSPAALLIELGLEPTSPYREAFAGRAGSNLASFGRMLAKWVELKDELPPLGLLDHILDDVRYQDYIDDGTDEGRDRWENVMELRRLAAEYNDQRLESFLEQIALVSDQDTLDANANVPTLLTLHAAKGLEFPTVFIVGLADGTLPHSRSLEDEEEMMEERRLLYVGITRAMDHLYLTCPEHRNSYGYAEPVDPSRFLADIPDNLVSDGRPRRERREHRPAPAAPPPSKLPSWDAPGRSAASVVQRYHPGMRVKHSVWGEGMVLNSRLQDGDENVDIFFEELGLKRVAASLAKLEILS